MRSFNKNRQQCFLQTNLQIKTFKSKQEQYQILSSFDNHKLKQNTYENQHADYGWNICSFAHPKINKPKVFACDYISENKIK